MHPRRQQCRNVHLFGVGVVASEHSGNTGTILLDVYGGNTRAWWTTDDVIGGAPCAPPENSTVAFYNKEPPHPFEVWCFENYTSPDTGRALLFGVFNGANQAKRLAAQLNSDVPIIETWSESVQRWRIARELAGGDS